MKSIIRCPKHGGYSSKRAISLVFCAAAVILAFTLAVMLMFMPELSHEALSILSSVIITFAFISGGAQYATLGGNKNIPKQIDL